MTETSSLNMTLAGLALALFCLLNTTALAQSPVTVTLSADKPGAAIPDDYLGVSFEMAMALPEDGKYYFRPANEHLLKTFKNLGIKNLRIGGNTADRPSVKFPSPTDLDSFFAFAKAADVKVIFTLRLREGDPKDAAATAKYLMEHYKSSIVCFAVGNEPNVFTKTYPEYKDAMNKYMALITAAGNCPGCPILRAGQHPGKARLGRRFRQRFCIIRLRRTGHATRLFRRRRR